MISLLFHVVRLLLRKITQTWWRHQMETFSALLAICAGNTPVPAQRPVTRSFHAFFGLHLNKPLSKQSWGWWFETISRPLSHCNELDWFHQSKTMPYMMPAIWYFKRFITWWRHQMETFPRYWPFCAEITGHYDVNAMSLNRQYFFTKGNVWSIADKWIRRSIEKLHPFFLVISSMEQQPLPNDWTALCFATFSFELTQFNTVIS